LEIEAYYARLNVIAPDEFAKYDKTVEELKVQLGYAEGDAKQTIVLNDDAELEVQEDEVALEQVDFEEKVSAITSTCPWTQSEAAATLLEQYRHNCAKFCKFLLRSYSSIKGSEYQTFDQVLGIEANDDRLLAMIIQNEQQDQNKARVEAFQSNTYSDFLGSPQTFATESLKKQLQSLLLNKLKTLEREELAKQGKLQKNALAIKLLRAPDEFYAYALMQEHKMSFGKGDFQKIIEVLKMGYDAEYRAVGNKLLLLREGRILRKGEKVVPEKEEADSDSDSSSSGYGAEEEAGEDTPAAEAAAAVAPPQCAPMFVDKARPVIHSSHSTNYKHVFQIWAQHVHLHPENVELSFEQLLEIFPEFTDRLKIYDACCNEKGQIVRNRTLYKQYKDAGHAGGKRGGQKVTSFETVAKKERRGAATRETTSARLLAAAYADSFPSFCDIDAPRGGGPQRGRGGRGGY